MVRLFQVGAGSGGMHVLDSLARDPRITHVTIVDHDCYESNNVSRHLLPPVSDRQHKVHLVANWLSERRPDLNIEALPINVCDSAHRGKITQAVADCDIGVCAVDNETAKFHFDALLRSARKPWTLGEVLSGGIGGLVHRFTPDGPCYGCVSSHLRRTTNESPAEKAPDYSAPGAAIQETRIPASKAAIAAIAGLHALVTLDLLDNPPTDPGFTSMLLSLRKVPGVFEDAYRPFRFRIPRLPECLICNQRDEISAGVDLDTALDEALTRLSHD